MRSNPEREDEDIELTGPIIWNYFKVAGVQSKSGGAKNVTCNFGDTVFVGCSSSRAFAHILGRPARRNQMLKHVYQCVKVMIIGMQTKS